MVTMDEGVGEMVFFASAAGNSKMKNKVMVDNSAASTRRSRG